MRPTLFAFERHAATARQESKLYVLPKRRLRELESPAREEADDLIGREPLRVISLDASGHGTSSPIPAGPVRFDIFAGDQDWSWTPPGAWTIASGQTLRVQWDVALAAGTLQLVEEATGLPLAERQVSISAEDAKGMVSWVMRDTDKQGKFEVKLVPAAYRLQFSYERGADGKPGPSPYADTRFDWTASGATQPVLKIAKKP